MYRARRLLTKAHERLNEAGDTKLVGLLRAGDPHGEVRMAWHSNRRLPTSPRSLHLYSDHSTRISRGLNSARRPGQPPSPIHWTELVQIVAALDITLFDLVMPRAASTVAISTPRTDRPHQLSLSPIHEVSDDQYAQMLFRLPAQLVTSSELDDAARRLTQESAALAIQQIRTELQNLLDRLDTLEPQEHH